MTCRAQTTQHSPSPVGRNRRPSPTSAVYGALPFLALIGTWALIVLIVNPVGEFMVNDDWSFIKALESLVFLGKPAATGWGPHGAPGGPSLIVHLLWGSLFTYFGGFSITVLRVSVLVMGAIGSIALFVLLRVAGAPRSTALVGSLTLVANPLFLSQCFTFMTDVTFTSMGILSILFLGLAVKRNHGILLAVGLLLSLCSILTRQIGVVIPAAFLIACFLHREGGRLGRLRSVIWVLALVILPWIGFEYALHLLGSTPLTEHQVVHRIISRPLTKGLVDYSIGLGGDALAALAYVGFLVSPVCALRIVELRKSKAFSVFFQFLTVGLAACEAAVLLGYFDPPVSFYRNVIVDFGIGPILLKDTYILGISRLPEIPKPLYCGLVYWAVLSAGACMFFATRIVRRTMRSMAGPFDESVSFLTIFSLSAAVLYMGIILLTGFHDRYLIPVCMFVTVGLVADMPGRYEVRPPVWNKAVPLLSLAAIFAFSVIALHDFMAMKSAQKRAQDYLIKELRHDPCRVDGGFEFNGYHCYSQGFREKPKMSWWWVEADDYVLTLGPLPGYRVIRVFPFRRFLGSQGAIHVLAPSSKAAS